MDYQVYDKDSIIDGIVNGINKHRAQESYYSPGEGFGDDFAYADPGFLSRRFGYHTRRDDRLEGEYSPVYEDEFDLAAIRQAARLLVERVPAAQAIRNRLTDYTIGQGFTWKIKHESPEVAAWATRAIEVFFDNCDWEDLEGESFEREHAEGEFLAELKYDTDVGIEIYESDHLSEPVSAAAINRWLGVDFDPSWTFGVLTQKNRQAPIAYHITRDYAGSDWDVIPERRFIHWKRNGTRNAKRGFSDHYVTHVWLGHGEKVLTRTAQGTAIQASIAYIVEHAQGTNRGQALEIANGRKNVYTRNNAFGEAQRSKRQIGSGHVVDVPNGSKYHASLLGQSASSIYIDVMEACLRLSGTVWAFPEHMMTGYAGNNNLASSETAESPFLQGRMRDQRKRARRMKRLIAKVLRCACDENPRARYGWRDIAAGLEIIVNEPQLVSRDISALTTSMLAQLNAGVIPMSVVRSELGYDNDELDIELENAQKDGRPVNDASGEGEQAGTYSGLTRQQWKRNKAAIDDVVGELQSGTITMNRASAMLRSLGLSPEVAKEVLSGVEVSESVLREQVARRLTEGRKWDESKHPRGKDGRFISRNAMLRSVESGDLKAAGELINDTRPQDHELLRKQIGEVSGEPITDDEWDKMIAEAQRQAAASTASAKGRRVMSDKMAENLNFEQRDAVFEYSGVGVDINRALREDRVDGWEYAEARKLQQIIQEQGMLISDDMSLKRIVTEEELEILKTQGWMLNKGFTSTTASELGRDRLLDDADDWGMEIAGTLEIEVEPGVLGVPLQGDWNPNFKYQDEVLLEPGLDFELISDDGKGNYLVRAYPPSERPTFAGPDVKLDPKLAVDRLMNSDNPHLTSEEAEIVIPRHVAKEFDSVEDVHEHLTKMVPIENDLPSLVGAGPGATVEITRVGVRGTKRYSHTPPQSEDSFAANVKSDDFDAYHVFVFRNEKGEITLHNDLVIASEDASPGAGRLALARQVREAKKLGAKHITLQAAGSDTDTFGMNGYYTWPRYGFDAEVEYLEPYLQGKVRGKFPEAKSVLDIFETKEGRDWWRDNGSDFNATFDLSDGSRSMAILAAYMEAKGEL